MTELPANAVRVSSRLTFVSKYAIPGFFLAITVLLLLNAIMTMYRAPDSHYWTAFLSAAPPAIGYFVLMMTPAFRVMGAVWVCDDALIVRNGWQTARIGMSNVKSMDGGSANGLSVITLELSQPCPWGHRIRFLSQGWSGSFVVNPVLQELRSRLHRGQH